MVLVFYECGVDRSSRCSLCGSGKVRCREVNKMNDFEKALKEFLDNEVSDYGLSYSYSIDFEDIASVTVKRYENEIDVNFRFHEKEGLQIELSEDSWYRVREYDWTVKYFWMLICPALFPYMRG